MKNHDWRNNHFHFGKWGEIETCLMEWRCNNCGNLITIPDSQEKPKGGECNGRLFMQRLFTSKLHRNKKKRHHIK